eukprot:CAMPEP_0116899324 /NCGR_PEP_ID=MMETSP0467-20121206/7920_1 /TAXON_ID=283647 /ORGANISM="Mesodinium pulex, Strain SPMC105" /LENGTH=62 /DNA_ID=CAMNT_0004572085 /DNA_START=18 /DNA_END=206 /DNA_ORIENTATION=-
MDLFGASEKVKPNITFYNNEVIVNKLANKLDRKNVGYMRDRDKHFNFNANQLNGYEHPNSLN